MRRIAIVGSGIIGLIAAYGLRKKGHAVTLYSDRTPVQWLRESRPTGTAARFELALSYERELGLNHWEEVAPNGEGVFLTFCPKTHQQLIRLFGRGEKPFQAVDMRMQCHRWLSDFEGRVVIENVTPERLESIAAENDLTLVAAGKSDLCNLFSRDAARSPYDAPQRNLTMVIATGRMSVDGCPYLPVKFEFLGTDGEIFFVPYLHKDVGASWNIVIEAKPGSRIDRFAGVRSGEEALSIAQNVVTELFPWSGSWIRGMKLADPMGWLSGRIAPTVRHPVAKLPSGRIVAGLGDTAISFDPIAAQGANTGVKQARHLVEAIAAHDGPLDEAFLTTTFAAFWNEHARWACAFNNMFLEPIPAPAKELLIAQTGSPAIADAFFANFNDPRLYTRAFLDMSAARALVRAKTGSWLRSAIAGRARVLYGLLRQEPRLSDAGAPLA
ncbi:MAG TPA: styrene monooxygenase/indole monooxygenase family protein, partial [Thermoanaerobaculia bacterium]|nr:styrene monooxygenase/indole monooxygenase family protein [Thermoanaerobaculia bacterium]